MDLTDFLNQEIEQIYNYIMHEMQDSKDNPLKKENYIQTENTIYNLIIFYGTKIYEESFAASKKSLHDEKAQICLKWRKKASEIIKELFNVYKNELIETDPILRISSEKKYFIFDSLIQKIDYTKNSVYFKLLVEIYISKSVYKNKKDDYVKRCYGIYMNDLYHSGNLPFSYLDCFNFQQFDKYLAINQCNDTFTEKQQKTLNEMYQKRIKRNF